MPDTAQLQQRVMDVAKKAVPADTRLTILRTRMRLRQPTARWRGLPDVLIVGGMRCGTSSLYKYLGYHPSIVPSLRKEADYFGRYFRKSELWYRSHFPLTARTRARALAGRGKLISFEASPYYLYHPFAPERAAALVPAAKIVVMLRDPVDRAFSHWQHMTRHGLETLSFSAAIAAENERLAPELIKMAADPEYFSRPHSYHSYVGRGLYAEQLERWLAHYPPEQFLIVMSADFYADPPGTFARVLDFLGVPQWRPATFENYSYLGTASGDVRNRRASAVDVETRDHLVEVFRADQERLPAVIAGMARA